MPSHPDLVAEFAGGLASGALPPGVTARDPGEAARRFAIHRNNIAHSLGEALAARFPAIRRLVGDAFFAALARAFALAHPPASPVLLGWGGEMPAFLERFPPVASLPYLADVARVETARGEAFHAADRDPLPPEALAAAAADPGAARLALHPSVRIVALRHAGATIWAANQPGRAPDGIDVLRPEIALVLRDRAFDVPVRVIGAGDAAFLAALAAGAPALRAAGVAARAEPGHDPGAILALLARAGALVSPSSEALP